MTMNNLALFMAPILATFALVWVVEVLTWGAPWQEFLALAVVLGGATYAQWRVWQVVNAPLQELEQAIQSMEMGVFDTPLPNMESARGSHLLAAFEDMRTTVAMAVAELEKAAEQADAANSAKSNFLANMSHELRTPMNGVLGMVEMMMSTPLSHEQQEFAVRIKKSAENLLVILNDILDFSKIEANALQLENIPYTLQDIAQEVVEMLSPLAAEKGLTLTLEKDAALPHTLVGDPGRVRQILVNLVGNAVKFTLAGGVKVHLTNGHDAEYRKIINVDVTDTGVGMAADKLHLLFKKFSQADASMARKFGGTGLGLAITKQLVNMMHGEITVASEVGVGSTFSFYLPVHKPSADMLAKHRAEMEKMKERTMDSTTAKLPLNQVSMLLVEDDPVNREVAQRLLGKLGITQIDMATDGQEAVGMFDPSIYNVIVMDCQMPNMDGFEATGHIRAREADLGTHLPIIAATANAMVGDREKCINSGMDDYVSKPIRLTQLKEVLGRYIQFDAAPETLAPVTEASVTTVPLLDIEHLQSFTDGDQKVEQELVQLFYDQANASLEMLSLYTDDAHAEDWKKLAHRLKGSSANLGASRLSAACLQAEQAKAAPEAEKLTLLAAIEGEMNNVRSFFAQRHGG
ncbi:MAG: ATP-binding protein [Alphaproteobacteria bacterium]